MTVFCHVVGTLPLVDVADLFIYYDSFLAEASQRSQGRGSVSCVAHLFFL